VNKKNYLVHKAVLMDLICSSATEQFVTILGLDYQFTHSSYSDYISEQYSEYWEYNKPLLGYNCLLTVGPFQLGCAQAFKKKHGYFFTRSHRCCCWKDV